MGFNIVEITSIDIYVDVRHKSYSIVPRLRDAFARRAIPSGLRNIDHDHQWLRFESGITAWPPHVLPVMVAHGKTADGVTTSEYIGDYEQVNVLFGQLGHSPMRLQGPHVYAITLPQEPELHQNNDPLPEPFTPEPLRGKAEDFVHLDEQGFVDDGRKLAADPEDSEVYSSGGFWAKGRPKVLASSGSWWMLVPVAALVLGFALGAALLGYF